MTDSALRRALGAAALLVALCLPCRADRAEVEALLARMQAAVLAADEPGYLACVDTDDPVFLAEQQHWAKDLQKHTPQSFALAITGDDGVFEPDRAECTLKMTWKMDESAGERTVSYPVLFARDPETRRWLYRGEKWLEFPGDHVLVKCLPASHLEATAQKVIEVFPEIRGHVNEGFQLSIDIVQHVKLYTSMRHLQASIYLSYTDGLSGWNEPHESIKMMVRKSSSPGELRTLLGHEYGHVATFVMGEQATDMPWWAAEGVAELAAEAFRPGSAERVEKTVRAWARNGKLVDWDKMADFRATPGEYHQNVYTQSHHLMAYVSQRWGRAARNAWIGAMAQGKPLDEATREAFKVPFATLDAQWRASLKHEPDDAATK
jgi:hypothetical protein